MAILRSYSDKDLLPGLEVRLLPHQLIGVSWYEGYTCLFSWVNLVAQDGRPREKIPSPRRYFSVSSVNLLLTQLMDRVYSEMRWALVSCFTFVNTYLWQDILSQARLFRWLPQWQPTCPRKVILWRPRSLLFPLPSFSKFVCCSAQICPHWYHFQWKDELDTKSNDLFTVHIYHGREKLSTLTDIRSKDVRYSSCYSFMMWLRHH
jgi:hypothetical protein